MSNTKVSSETSPITPVTPRKSKRPAPTDFVCIRGCGCFFKDKCWGAAGHSAEDKQKWAEERQLKQRLHSLRVEAKIARLEALRTPMKNITNAENTGMPKDVKSQGGSTKREVKTPAKKSPPNPKPSPPTPQADTRNPMAHEDHPERLDPVTGAVTKHSYFRCHLKYNMYRRREHAELQSALESRPQHGHKYKGLPDKTKSQLVDMLLAVYDQDGLAFDTGVWRKVPQWGDRGNVGS